jgi:hypothetical protein
MVADLSGMFHTAAVVNGAQWIANGYRGGAYQFDGANDYLSAGKPPGLTAQISNRFTLSCWINPSNDHEGYIVGRARSSYNDLSMYINDPMNQGINFTMKRLGGPEHFMLSSSGGWSNLPNGTWTHIAQTYNGAQFVGYINGQAVVSSNITGEVDNNGNDFILGDRHTLDRHFQGKIDEVKVYNRGLYASEIYTLYTSGVATLTKSNHTHQVPENFSFTNVASRRAYTLSAWRDTESDFEVGATEAWCAYSNNPVLLTAAVSGVDMPLIDPDADADGMPDWWEIQYGLNPTCNVPGAGEGWWKFDEGTGSNITNSANSLYGGNTVNMGSTNWVAG